MSIIDYIPLGSENAINRSELVSVTGLPDRIVRREIQEAKEKGEIIINTMDGCGYFRPILPEDKSYVKSQYGANQARLISMSKQQKHLRVLMKEQGIEY